MNPRNAVTLRTTTGPTVIASGMLVTPESRVLTVRLPFGGFVWNRPSAVIVERDGRVERLPIVDVTRVMLGVLWASSLAAWLALRRRCR
jgi:hypothetical protein